MQYRNMPRSEKKISVIGIGSSVIGKTGKNEIVKTFETAINAGINYFDLATDYPVTFSAMGEVMEGRREEIFLQVHFGADYTSGEYGWSLDLEKVKLNFYMEMKELKTDYIDVAMIHCIDEISDFVEYKNNGILDFICGLKNNGVVKHIGLATHTIETAHYILDLNLIDILMFSINPVYDYNAISGYNNGKRQELYDRCKKEGVAIVAMKTFCGGQLLDKKQSPFHIEMTPSQCIQYVLDRPSVVTTVLGCNDEMEVIKALEFFDIPDADCNYSFLNALTPDKLKIKCVYCMHCHPCPANLDVALINKYYDLAINGDTLAREHYHTLEKKAGDCISCGHCDNRCPFNVPQQHVMQMIKSYFGE